MSPDFSSYLVGVGPVVRLRDKCVEAGEMYPFNNEADELQTRKRDMVTLR